ENADATYDFNKHSTKFKKMKDTGCGFASVNQKTGTLYTDSNYESEWGFPGLGRNFFVGLSAKL
ncbi:MAG: hypothetical protein WC581_07555, partial [Thermodesulfovibrionales bacterium]